MAEIVQRSFTSGEIAPSLRSRVDINKYQSGLALCENFIVRVQGGSIWIETASCPRQLCRRMGRTNQPTRALVCIPNDIRIRVLGEAGEIDAIAR